MRHELISDLHKLLFSVPFESVKDSPKEWDLNVKLGRAFLNHHSVHFKDKEEILDNEYWNTDDVEEKFYDLLHPGGFISVICLEVICEGFLDLDMWEKNRKLNDVFYQAKEAIEEITHSYEVVAVASQAGNVIMIEPPLKDVA